MARAVTAQATNAAACAMVLSAEWNMVGGLLRATEERLR